MRTILASSSDAIEVASVAPMLLRNTTRVELRRELLASATELLELLLLAELLMLDGTAESSTERSNDGCERSIAGHSSDVSIVVRRERRSSNDNGWRPVRLRGKREKRSHTGLGGSLNGWDGGSERAACGSRQEGEWLAREGRCRLLLRCWACC